MNTNLIQFNDANMSIHNIIILIHSSTKCKRQVDTLYALSCICMYMCAKLNCKNNQIKGFEWSMRMVFYILNILLTRHLKNRAINMFVINMRDIRVSHAIYIIQLAFLKTIKDRKCHLQSI